METGDQRKFGYGGDGSECTTSSLSSFQLSYPAHFSLPKVFVRMHFVPQTLFPLSSPYHRLPRDPASLYSSFLEMKHFEEEEVKHL